MTGISIDSHSAFVRLTDSGLPEKQAEAVVQTLQEATIQNVATKDDVRMLKDEIMKAKVDVFRWAVPLLVGQIALFAVITELLTFS